MQGLGVDIVSLKDFELIMQGSTAFAQDHFTAHEVAYCEKAHGGALMHLAARYAAKESCIKALESTLLFKPPLLKQIKYTEIEITHDPYGRPYIEFHGDMKAVVAQMQVKALVSLSHDGEYALAQVVVI